MRVLEKEEEEEKENNSVHLFLSKDAYKFLVKVEASNYMKIMIKHSYSFKNICDAIEYFFAIVRGKSCYYKI